MKTQLSNLLRTALILLLISSSVVAQQTTLEQLEEIAIIDQKVMVPMRDGVRLATDVIRPKTDQPVPIVFVRTPYNFNPWQDGELQQEGWTYTRALEAVKRGYAMVVQNERGRFFSEGEWDILGTPLTDGYDAFSWMADQPWSNGKVGTFGCSSTAEWQMAVASLDHPAHEALVAMGFGAGVGRVNDWYEQGNWYRGGAEQMLFFSWLYGVQNDVGRPTLPSSLTQEDLIRISRSFDLAPERPDVDWSEAFWKLPVTDLMKSVDGPIGVYEEMIRRKPNDADWYAGGLYHDDMPFDKASLWFMSWYDVSTGPNLALFNHVRENAVSPETRDQQFAVIAPTLHCGYWRATEETVVGELSVGDATFDYDDMIYGFLDLKLKGEDNGFLENTPRVQYYTMGSNEWRSSDTWPPEDSEMVTYYLRSDGDANSLFGDGALSTDPPSPDEPADAFTYDPLNPVMSDGGNFCCMGNAATPGSFDQRETEARKDILVYSTDPLEEGVEVTGTIEITLYVSSDARDTDFTVKLVDVHPDGRAFNIDETIQRARYREGYESEVFMEDGEVYELHVSPMSTSNYFAPGHRIRIEVSSSNFPRFVRNLNTGGNNYDETEAVVARNVVHHTVEYPSQIRLPVRR